MSEKGSTPNNSLTDKETKQFNDYLLLDVLLENIPDTIYFKDLDSRFIRINMAQAKFLGLEKPEEAIGKTDFDFFFYKHAQNSLDDEKKVITLKQPLLDKVEKIRKLDGTLCYMSASKIPVFNKEGEIIGIAGISRDVTERKLAEDRLELFAEKLAKSNKELESFASVASHDLQEPLRKIVAFGDRLQKKFTSALGEEGVDYLQRMQSAATRMHYLINDLLTFSRVSTKEHQFDPLDLNEVLEEVISDLEIRIEQTEGKINYDPLPVIEADKSLMRQLFQNLIGNALKFHREGVPPVINITSFEVERTDSPEQSGFSTGDFCEICIEDNGIGFEEEFYEKIFAIFQRLHNREKYEGTGIGLATCRKIVEKHHGTINVTSKLGEGTKFTINLPIKYKSL